MCVLGAVGGGAHRRTHTRRRPAVWEPRKCILQVLGVQVSPRCENHTSGGCTQPLRALHSQQPSPHLPTPAQGSRGPASLVGTWECCGPGLWGHAGRKPASLQEAHTMGARGDWRGQGTTVSCLYHRPLGAQAQ